jgi:hypothetical protein
MFIVYVHTKFHAFVSNGSLVIAVKVTSKWKFSHGRHVIPFILKNILIEVQYIFKIYYRTSSQDPKLSGPPTSLVRLSAMLLPTQ